MPRSSFAYKYKGMSWDVNSDEGRASPSYQALYLTGEGVLFKKKYLKTTGKSTDSYSGQYNER